MQMHAAPPRLPDWTDANVHLWWRAARAGEEAPRARRGRLDALLRQVLARYVARAPDALRFGREARGRPFLIGDGMPDFNLSDTPGGTVIAVAGQGRLGVDLERTDREPPHRRLARRYFAASECAQLEAMADDEARLAFLRLWTAKESSCKSTGTGIYGQLPRWVFDAHALAPRLLALPAQAGDAARWHHLRVTPAPHYTAVLACDGYVPRVLGFSLDDDSATPA
jgi:4'-phosphopantetheinyl transferase